MSVSIVFLRSSVTQRLHDAPSCAKPTLDRRVQFRADRHASATEPSLYILPAHLSGRLEALPLLWGRSGSGEAAGEQSPRRERRVARPGATRTIGRRPTDNPTGHGRTIETGRAEPVPTLARALAPPRCRRLETPGRTSNASAIASQASGDSILRIISRLAKEETETTKENERAGWIRGIGRTRETERLNQPFSVPTASSSIASRM